MSRRRTPARFSHVPFSLALLPGVLLLPAAQLGCGGGSSARAGPAETASPALPIATPDAVLRATRDSARQDSATEARFRNVDFQIAPGLVLGIRHLRGQMEAKTPGMPVVFDDKQSFLIRLTSAEVAMDMASLGRLMNDHVFAYRGAPLRNLTFSTAGDQLTQRGTLHKVVNIPFRITARVSVTDSGHIRIHPTAMRIFSVRGEGLMKALGIELDDLLDLEQAKGVRVDGNDLLLDPDRLLPPPAIRGRLTAVRIEPGKIVQVFGDSAAAARLPAITPPDTTAPNYMYFRHGTLRFGKLFMVQADMQIIDLNPEDPFDFSIDRYNDQLVAGYSRNTPDLGLEVFMPDLAKVGRGTVRAVPGFAQPPH
ncbi:MAG: hypothetical protein ACREON_17265 [Gemmatimonadaceae bacterium]